MELSNILIVLANSCSHKRRVVGIHVKGEYITPDRVRYHNTPCFRRIMVLIK
jgi:hypothetical protein